MIKRDNDFSKYEVLNVNGVSNALGEEIGLKTRSHQKEDVLVEEFHLKPNYGSGHITNFVMNDIELTISKFQLSEDIVLAPVESKDCIQISFLMEGEKIISLPDGRDILYESGESYLASIQSFNGYSRVAGSRPYREIKIRLSTSFFMDHGFADEVTVKEITDDNLILPITDELLTVLGAIGEIDLMGTARKIYVQAKVLELLAIQMGNYKNELASGAVLKSGKNLKKLYEVKSIIKNNLHKNFSLQELSQDVGLNQNYLNKEFNRVFGYTVSKFSIDEKIKKAKMMLQNTKHPIYQIAEEVGYKNATHFSAAFKRYTSETPKQYRAKI